MPQSIRILAVSTPVYKAGDVRARFTTAGGELVEVVLRAGLAKSFAEGIHAALNPAAAPAAPIRKDKGRPGITGEQEARLRELFPAWHRREINIEQAAEQAGVSRSTAASRFAVFRAEKAPVLKPGGKLL